MVNQEEEEEDVRNKILGSLEFLAIKKRGLLVTLGIFRQVIYLCDDTQKMDGS